MPTCVVYNNDRCNNVAQPFCRINSGILSACKTAAAAPGVGIRLLAWWRRRVCRLRALSRSLTRNNDNIIIKHR